MIERGMLENGREVLRLRKENAALKDALHRIAYEPIGDPEDSAVKVLAGAVQIAKDALAPFERGDD